MLAPLVIILAAINGVVDILLATGIPTSLSLILLSLTGGNLLLAAIISLLICIILGLGMPTAAAYLIVAVIIAPTLISEFGVPVLSAHFFVFYAAILAAITPPIATSVAVGTGIAGSNFWSTAKEALKIGLPLFLLPFVFIYNPVSLSVSFPGPIGLALLVLILAGTVTLTIAVTSQRLVAKQRRPLRYSIRFLLGVAGLAVMVYPGIYVKSAVIGVVIFVAILYRFLR